TPLTATFLLIMLGSSLAYAAESMKLFLLQASPEQPERFFVFLAVYVKASEFIYLQQKGGDDQDIGTAREEKAFVCILFDGLLDVSSVDLSQPHMFAEAYDELFEVVPNVKIHISFTAKSKNTRIDALGY
ncbi:hypothetical protein ACJX0J_032623, partial [Zea mays]